ncbi:hypothetical protein IGI04_042512 [Brassica rapa subsp. trilocularis]|uniref:DUF4283 domain-containing protein n=1 Tax=Brassica rapa subsp. trilocularis TaxID=1813537 RepID=A0ABQ7KL46_BRACM|nr:hypothetical protein IGI04_042512 [Brassica rapa subsp. trilocularis]
MARRMSLVANGKWRDFGKQSHGSVKAWKVILLHFGELPTTKEPLDKEGAVWIRFPQAREAGDRLVLGIIEVSGYVCCLFFCGWVYLRFSGGNMDMKHESSGVVKIQEENKWVWPRWVKTALGSCEIWSNQEGAKRKKGRLRRRSKAQIRRGRCWKRSILSGYQGSYGTMKMGREEAQQILMGECSYSAYMGESVESSGVMRKLETKGADERVTKDEWDEFVNPITDQNQLRSTKQKLVVVKKMPKLENEYGDHYTRPPDPMQHENQVIMSIGQGVLREIIDILLGIHKELVRPPDQSARFLLVFRDLMLSFYPGEHRTHAETAMVEACLWSKWREAFAAAAGYELNGKESFVCYILRHVRSLEMIEQGSKSLLKHGKGLQSWVFDPGDDHVSIILQVSDLRTNPFEGREDGVTLISSILKNMKSRKEEAMKWIMARPDELYGKLKGLIHEVLDREKAMGLDVAFIKHGLTLDNHGRPVITLIDKEMDRMKLVRQEMEWEIQSDREMDWSNRHMRELSWKWKIENQSRKWNMMRTFIIRMSIRSSLVGPGTRWIEPKKELFEKGLYRPEKWKDKPAWFMIGPI